MVRGRFAPVALGCLTLSLTGSPLAAQTAPRFDAETLVAMEGFGAVRLSPDGRWAVVEREGRYDRAPTYAYATMTADTLSDLMVFDQDGRRPARVIGTTDRAGYRSGPISPDGRRMAVFRLLDGVRTLGVLTFETGEILWTEATPDLAVLGRTVAWRGDRELIVLVTPDRQLPLFHRLGLPTQARVAGFWRSAAEGREPTAVALYSGRLRDRRAQAVPGAVVRVSADSGAVSVLQRGEFIDLELSPDGARAAVLENGEDLQPRDDEPPTMATPTRRRRLKLIDLASGAVEEPSPDCDILWFLLAWSADSRSLLTFGRPLGARWADGEFLRIDTGVAGTATAVVRAPGARPVLLWSPLEKAPFVRGGWSGSEPVLFVEQGGRRQWRTGAGDLFSDVEDGYAPLARVGTDVGLAGVNAQRVGPEALAVAGLRPVPPDTVADAGGRDRFNPVDVEVGRQPLADPAGCLHPPGFGGAPFCPGATGGRLLAASEGGRAALILERDSRGPSRIRRLTAEGGDEVLTEINRNLASIAWGRVQEVQHSGPGGRRVKSWLLVPPGAPPPRGWPLVVLHYPGADHPIAPAELRPGAWNSTLSAQVLSGAGYAVLTPSLPLEPGGPADLPDLSSSLDAAIDAALDAGGIDPTRLALAGHSYGGHGALLVATRSSRFRAIISVAGDAAYPATMYDARAIIRPEDGLNFAPAAAYMETGQGGVGAPLSRDVPGWIAASPLFRAEAIQTPLLMIWMDQDPQGAEALFGQLYRHNRDAALVTYFGESHTISSPANMIDLHWRVLDWLEVHLAGPDASEPLDPAHGP